MAVTGICIGCKKSYTIGNKAIGKKFKCKNCGSVIEVTAHQAGVNYDFIPDPEPEESDGKSRKLLSILGRVVFALLVILGLVAIVMTLIGPDESEPDDTNPASKSQTEVKTE